MFLRHKERRVSFWLFPESLLPTRLQIVKGTLSVFSRSLSVDCIFPAAEMGWSDISSVTPQLFTLGDFSMANSCCWLNILPGSLLTPPHPLPWRRDFSGSGLQESQFSKSSCQKSIYDSVWYVVPNWLLRRHHPWMLIHQKWEWLSKLAWTVLPSMTHRSLPRFTPDQQKMN